MTIDYSGYWTGEIRGTNVGKFTLDLKQDGTVLSGVASINEPALGQYRYELEGVAGDSMSCTMKPVWRSGAINLGTVTAVGTIEESGKLIGKWSSTIGTNGIFDAERFGDASLRRELPTENSIFIVHGHDDACKQSVARYLESLKLAPVILHEQVNQGKTIIEKFEDFASRAGYAIILATPDDYGYQVGREEDKKKRARQNVILELGYFVGKLGRSKTILLVRDEVELPSDMMGVMMCKMDATDGWRMTLAKELAAAGFKFNMNDVIK